MADRIEVGFKVGIRDALGEVCFISDRSKYRI